MNHPLCWPTGKYESYLSSSLEEEDVSSGTCFSAMREDPLNLLLIISYLFTITLTHIAPQAKNELACSELTFRN